QRANERSATVALLSTDPPALTAVRCEEAHPPTRRTAPPAAASMEASGRSMQVAQHSMLSARAAILRGSLELPEKRYAGRVSNRNATIVPPPSAFSIVTTPP